MEYIKAMEIRQRICDKYRSMQYCKGCPLRYQETKQDCGCSTFMERYPEQAEIILTKWDEENPVKTFLSDFLEKHPKAMLSESGIPSAICPERLGYCKNKGCKFENCVDCWNRPLESEVTE